VEGEIYVAGVALARGYLNNPVMTNSKFIEHPKVKLSRVYKTGDYARWLPDGNIEFIGRIDGQVKIRGYRLELGEIESVLLRHESIKDAVVFDKEEPDGTRSLTAYFVSDENLGLAGLREFMGLSLICFMVPNHLVRVDSFPLTVSGKIDKQALINRSSLEIDTIGYFPPTCPDEECMVAIWEEFFDKKVGIKDNFFELGGNSLMAIKIVTRLQEHFNVSINEFFMNQTIEILYHNVIKNSATIA
ncbi:MAG: peptide synthetase, partial [Azospira oryzae]